MALQTMFQQTEWWRPQELERAQLVHARMLLTHAVRTVPFYREPPPEVRAIIEAPADKVTMEMFRSLPIMPRKHVQSLGESLFATSVPESHGKIMNVSTSGSTGQPLRIKTTNLSSQMFMAQGLRYHQWHRRDFRLSSMTITSLSPDITVQKTSGWVGGFRTGPGYRVNFSMPSSKIFDALLEADPAYLQTHPSTLQELLRLSRKTGKRPANLLEVRSVSEALPDALRAECLAQWGAKTTNNYSAQEMNILALQCPEHPSHLHVQSESVILEVVDSAGNPCKPGEAGKCLATQLINYATPLFRYEFGDYAVVGDSCDCGRGLPVIAEVMGRERNLLKLRGGEKLSPRLALEDIVSELPVLQYQLIQKSYEDVEIRLATETALTPEQEQIVIAKCEADIGQPLNYFVTYHPEIPKLPSGKFEAFRCEVPEDDEARQT